MQIGRAVVVGAGGLLGEIFLTELARYGDVTQYRSVSALTRSTMHTANVIVVWSAATDIGELRAQLYRAWPAAADPLLVVLNQAEPYIYFTRLRALHVERLRLGFNDLFNEIAVRIAAGQPTTAPVRAGSV